MPPIQRHFFNHLKAPVWVGVMLLALFSLMPYVPFSTPMTDIPSHFVLQYAIGSIVLMFFVLALRMRKRYLLILAVCFTLNVATLAPYIAHPPATVATHTTTLKILQVNTLFLNRHTDALKTLIETEQPDIVTAVEVNTAFADMFAALKDSYPHQHIAAQDADARGLAVISRIPLTDYRLVTFGDPRIPAQRFRITRSAMTVDMLSLHPFTPIANLPSRDADLRVVAAAYTAEKPARLIVTGDFNATPWCPIMKEFTAQLHLRHAREAHGVLPSWPAFLPARFLRIPIDHVLVSDGMTVLDYRLGPAIGSDHLPTIALIGIQGTENKQ